MRDAIETACGWVDASTRIVALTGAGISTDSGIPDFRGPQGVWTKNPKAERLSNIHHYLADPEVRKLSWKSRLDHPAWRAQPNAAHAALVALERNGKLHALITQNIDGLHQRAGTSPDKVIEVHGTMREVMCMTCDWRGPMEPVLDRVRRGEEDPPCEQCRGVLKSATISFGRRVACTVSGAGEVGACAISRKARVQRPIRPGGVVHEYLGACAETPSKTGLELETR